MTKPLRLAMPGVAGFIDDLRAAFGASGIDAAIKGGMQGRDTFWAREGGQEIGRRAAEGQGITYGQYFHDIRVHGREKGQP